MGSTADATIVRPARPALLRAVPTPPAWRETAAGDTAERLARREALLHRLELDRQRRRHRSA